MDTVSSTPTSHRYELAISARYTANPNHACSHFLQNFRAHMIICNQIWPTYLIHYVHSDTYLLYKHVTYYEMKCR